MLVGRVYRICVLNIPLRTGQEVFPTIEIVDRLYPPIGQELRFPIQIDLPQEDLQLAIAGKFVTRVIYLEDPERALPVGKGEKDQNWFDVGPGKDPLVVADSLGRPVAIVRMGGRVPDAHEGLDSSFLFGSPPVMKFWVEANRSGPQVQLTPPVPPARTGPQVPTSPPAPPANNISPSVRVNPFVPEPPSAPRGASSAAAPDLVPPGEAVPPTSVPDGKVDRLEPHLKVMPPPPRKKPLAGAPPTVDKPAGARPTADKSEVLPP